MLSENRKLQIKNSTIELLTGLKEELIMQYSFIIGFHHYLESTDIEKEDFEKSINMDNETLEDKRNYISDLLHDGYYERIYEIVDDEYLILPHLLDSFCELLDDIDVYISDCTNDESADIDYCKAAIILDVSMDYLIDFNDIIYYILNDGITKFQESDKYNEYISSYSHFIGIEFNMRELLEGLEEKVDQVIGFENSDWCSDNLQNMLSDIELSIFDRTLDLAEDSLDEFLTYNC